MSRLDDAYLEVRNYPFWRVAYEDASKVLGLPPASLKNLRDEFDPFFDNGRKGWWRREIREDRKRVLLEFEAVSDAALLELVDRVFMRDEDATHPVLEVLSEAPKRVANVADRLLTGRLAEEYFIEHFSIVLGISGATLCDMRSSAQGFDFGLSHLPEVAIEVKGLRRSSGSLLFTDREWREASVRRDNYWLAIIGDLETIPRHSVLKDPRASLSAICSYQTTIAASWSAKYRFQDR
jgi:hypothetical protein